MLHLVSKVPCAQRNAEALMSQFGWQLWLLRVLSVCRRPSDDSSGVGSDGQAAPEPEEVRGGWLWAPLSVLATLCSNPCLNSAPAAVACGMVVRLRHATP